MVLEGHRVVLIDAEAAPIAKSQFGVEHVGGEGLLVVPILGGQVELLLLHPDPDVPAGRQRHAQNAIGERAELKVIAGEDHGRLGVDAGAGLVGVGKPLERLCHIHPVARVADTGHAVEVVAATVRVEGEGRQVIRIGRILDVDAIRLADRQLDRCDLGRSALAVRGLEVLGHPVGQSRQVTDRGQVPGEIAPRFLGAARIEDTPIAGLGVTLIHLGVVHLDLDIPVGREGDRDAGIRHLHALEVGGVVAHAQILILRHRRSDR